MPVVGSLESGRPGGPMCRSDPGSCPVALQLFHGLLRLGSIVNRAKTLANHGAGHFGQPLTAQGRRVYYVIRCAFSHSQIVLIV